MLTDTLTAVAPSSVPSLSAPESAFRRNHRLVVGGLKKTLEVMDALREIYEGEQWKDSYESFEGYCNAAALEAEVTFGYKRAMQLIEASRRREALSVVSTPVEVLPEEPSLMVTMGGDSTVVPLGRAFRSEKALRALPSQEDPAFLSVAQLAVSEAQRRGMQGPSEGLVRSVTNDVKALTQHGLDGFDEVQLLFAPWGVFDRFTVTNKRVQRFRYQFSAPSVLHQHQGITKLFTDLKEAIAFYQDWCLPSRRLKTVGCLTCQNCDLEGGQVNCGAVGQPVKLTEIWAKGRCLDYSPLSGDTTKTPFGLQAKSSQVVLPTKPATPAAPEYTHSAGMLGHQGAGGGAGGSDEYYTPEYIWRPALAAWERSEFDLDAATTDNSPIPARVRYTKDRSGLLLPWDVNGADEAGKPVPIFTWGNFPYSLNGVFVPRLERYWEEGAISHAFILEKTDNRTGWYQTLLRICTAFCLIDHGVGHISEAGEEEKGGFFGSTLFYLGDRPELFHDAYDFLGPICQVTTREHFAY